MKCIFDHKEHWRDSGKHTCYRDHRKEERRNSGNRGKDSKGKEGDSWKNDRMGLPFPSLCPLGESGKKIRVQKLGTRGHAFMLTKVCISKGKK